MRSFEEIPDIAERIKRSKMELQESGFYWAPEWDSQSCCDQDYVNNFKKGWDCRQTEVDALTLQVAEMKSKLNDAYTDGQSAMYTARQTEVDELQRRNQMLNDNIKEQGQKLVYQNEVIETQAEKLLGLRDEKAELQKRLDAALEVVKQGIRKQGGDYYLEKVEELLEGGDC